MSSNRGQVSESPAERAMAEMAMQKMADYKQRWQPVHQRIAEITHSMGAAGSAERRQQAGKATADTEQAFGGAEDKLTAGLMNKQIGAGSSKFRLGLEGMGTDRGIARGMAKEGAEQAIDEAYVGGLQQLMAIGKGQNAIATRGASDAARIGGQQARDEAQLAATRRAGQYDTAGTFAGLGIGAAKSTDWSKMLAPASMGEGRGGIGLPSGMIPGGSMM